MRASRSPVRRHSTWRRKPLKIRLLLELLEDRSLPSSTPLSTVVNLPALTPDPGAYDPQTILVRFRPGAAHAAALDGTSLGKDFSLVPGLQLVHLGKGVGVDAAVHAYKANPNVLYAEPNYRVHVALTPNDTNYSLLYGLNNTGQTGGVADADIDAPEAWDIATGSKSIVVAVIDTGVDYTHPDLADNIWTNPGEL